MGTIQQIIKVSIFFVGVQDMKYSLGEQFIFVSLDVVDFVFHKRQHAVFNTIIRLLEIILHFFVKL